MKPMKHIITVLAFVVLGTSAYAQSANIDGNRMNRDIRILENVLSEFFKVGQLRNSNNGDLYFSIGSSSNVRGTYLPGYGVIFMVPKTSYSTRSNRTAPTFYYGEDGKNAITEENITSRIKEFLRDYAATVGQLDDSEKVMVIYGANRNSRSAFNLIAFNRNSNSKNENPIDKIPVISVVANKKDINDFKSGKANESSFMNNLSVAKNQERELLDLKVLGNIFQTALEEDEGYDFHLTSRSSMGYLYMPNFGALYTLNVHVGHNRGRNVISGAVVVDGQSVITDIAEYQDQVDKANEERMKAIKEEYDELLGKMKEFMVDYARTLVSVKSDQYLLVTVNITDRLDDIPDRIDFQLKKSVLEQVDSGSLSRNAAINQVVVREY